MKYCESKLRQEHVNEAWEYVTQMWLFTQTPEMKRALAEEDLNHHLSQVELLQSYWPIINDLLQKETPERLLKRAQDLEAWHEELKQLKMRLTVIGKVEGLLKDYNFMGLLKLIDTLLAGVEYVYSLQLENEELAPETEPDDEREAAAETKDGHLLVLAIIVFLLLTLVIKGQEAYQIFQFWQQQ